MSKYGLPYQGSKSVVADEIIEVLPKGNRLVDLFGGGFAISECAIKSKKWSFVLYNDFNPLIVDLVKQALNGNFNYNIFKPKFITRQEFIENKNKNGYIKYIWSFGSNGKDYLFGKKIEQLKHLAHNFVVFGDYDDTLNDFLAEQDRILNETDIKKRRLEFYCKIKKQKKRFDLQQLEQLERLQQLEQLERLQQLEISSIDYKNYEHNVGDIVYCDIPYENTRTYDNTSFNHKEFYEWASTRQFAVYFSSYPINDNRFTKIWSKQRRSCMSAQNNNVYREECLYCNNKALGQREVTI